MKIKNIVNYEGEIVFNTSMPDGIDRKLLSSQKISDLGWSPIITLEKGLEDTYTWYKQNL
jgi:GDP-L-fucose synthase